MVTPGLLPEPSERRLSAWPFTLALLGILLLGGGVYLALQVRSLRAERDGLRKEIVRARVELANFREREEARARDAREERARAPAPAEPRNEGERPEAPARAADVRVVAAVSPEASREKVTQGLHEFRSGRFLQAELCFLRAGPEAVGYVVLTCFVRGEVREAVASLGRALAAEPQWLRRVKPRDLFGQAEEYEKSLRALEERVAADPLDADAKTLLAYFRLHDQGAEYAKALLVEATNARPDHAEARRLLSSLSDGGSH